MSVTLISANLGKFDKDTSWPMLGANVIRLTDSNYPPRASMGARLQSKLPKCFGWQMFPGADIYGWLDGSFQPQDGFVDWALEHLGDHDMVVVAHPWRNSIKEEFEFVQSGLARGSKYLTKRYTGDDLVGQYQEILNDKDYQDTRLFASGMFFYHDRPQVRAALTAWWLHISRYTCLCQLSFPFVLKDLDLAVIQTDIYHDPHMVFVR